MMKKLQAARFKLQAKQPRLYFISTLSNYSSALRGPDEHDFISGL
jgi:hypothetical protein